MQAGIKIDNTANCAAWVWSRSRAARQWRRIGGVKARGFILQASYRVINGAGAARVPVVHIYGRLENGETFLLRDSRQRPHFYIRTADVARARAIGIPEPIPLDKRAFDGAPVSRLDMQTPPDVPGLRERLHAADIETFEADVRFAVRYLIERGVKAVAKSKERLFPARA
jgi:DNA polymerase-2